ncbi:MAG: right-handed parallel beta-helix repeat-containing protein [Bacteroidia bacterium]|nr:right-handed parallel beta-helix repeat-containing protein [Bacteroidia bacterium]
MKTIILSALLFITTLSCFAQTIIPGGNISGTWTLVGSPYLIQGSIQVPNDSTLSIEPGVTINFQGTYKLFVQGRIIAIGTSTDTIIFTAANTANGWRGIRFDNTPSTNDTSKFICCKLQYGKATGTATDVNGGAFYFNNFSKVLISNCNITDCMANGSGGGICCDNKCNPIITNNTILNNTANNASGGGICCFLSSPTISNNTISNNQADNYGGGIYCYDNSNPTILNNTISNNTAANNGYGGGIYCEQSNPTISNNTISGNITSYGGGIYSFYSNPNISHNTILSNTADYGSGIYCEYSDPTISNNAISNNTASFYGGGIYCYYFNPTIINNTISNNIANEGGGIYCSNFNPNIINNKICNNLADNGGGIYCVNSIPTISNNTISNNTANKGGGIYCFYNSNLIITNSTIANNSAVNGGAIYCTNATNPILLNTILWGNTASISGQQLYLSDEDCDPNIYYSNVQGGTASFELNGNFFTGNYSNNINMNPLFVLPSGGSGTGYNGVTANWSLQSTSPCINAGDPVGSYPTSDIAGNPRVVAGTIDIGAYEYQSPTSLTVSYSQTEFAVYPNPTNGKFVIKILDQNSNEGNMEIEILNMLGEVIYSKIFDTKQATYYLDISSTIDGIYFVKVYNKEKYNIEKIVKL